MMAEIAQTDPHAIVVVEAAILVETGRYRALTVDCRHLHSGATDGTRIGAGSYNQEEILARLSRQLPLEEKLRVADYVIDTSGIQGIRSIKCESVYGSLRSLSV